MDKVSLVQAIVQHFQRERDLLAKAAQATYEAATHEDNRAENKYDTRGLEASYLAESQSKRASDILQTVNIYKALAYKTFTEDEPIAMSALVTVKDKGEVRYYFLGPRGGGAAFEYEGKTITIITGASPLCRTLMGQEVGDVVEFGPRGASRELEILDLA